MSAHRFSDSSSRAKTPTPKALRKSQRLARRTLGRRTPRRFSNRKALHNRPQGLRLLNDRHQRRRALDLRDHVVPGRLERTSEDLLLREPVVLEEFGDLARAPED